MSLASRSPESGQIVIPALFVLPCLFLFVWLLFETVKLSTNKIRLQFAVDAGTSMEAGLYSSYLNRLAYVNGPFPDRLFASPELTASAVRYAQDYDTGFFPRSMAAINDEMDRWPFLWSPRTRSGMNQQYPLQYTPVLFINQEASSTRMAIFMTVWHKLGYIVDAHEAIFNAHNANHSMLREIMHMNLNATGYENTPLPKGKWDMCADPETCGDEAASSFFPVPITKHVAIGFEDNDDDELVYFLPPLFQCVTVKQPVLDDLKDGHVVAQSWEPGKNYFGVDFGRQTVRNHYQVLGGRVWMDPTPHYRAVLEP